MSDEKSDSMPSIIKSWQNVEPKYCPKMYIYLSKRCADELIKRFPAAAAQIKIIQPMPTDLCILKPQKIEEK